MSVINVNAVQCTVTNIQSSDVIFLSMVYGVLF